MQTTETKINPETSVEKLIRGPVGNPLLPALAKDEKFLSKEGRTIINRWMKREPAAFTFQLILAWAVIIASIVFSESAHHPAGAFLAVFLIATRQNLLGLLVHEQAHCLGFKPKLGDLLTNFVTVQVPPSEIDRNWR